MAPKSTPLLCQAFLNEFLNFNVYFWVGEVVVEWGVISQSPKLVILVIKSYIQALHVDKQLKRKKLDDFPRLGIMSPEQDFSNIYIFF